ncbi:hypothetical protein [Nisaea sediminum]|jgi:hypothetical protein|uniref:hypothetical protein n=1 Tax=Nisaea sediminum TaxID=2775867 RepID=UPI001867D5E5|nr:hypothetical protein [Nisaea sediminum]
MNTVKRQTRLSEFDQERIKRFCQDREMTLEEYFTLAIEHLVSLENVIFRAVPKRTPAFHVRYSEDQHDNVARLATRNSATLSSVLYTAICTYAEDHGVFS